MITNMSEGTGQIVFDSEEAARRACQTKNGIKFADKILKVKLHFDDRPNISTRMSVDENRSQNITRQHSFEDSLPDADLRFPYVSESANNSALKELHTVHEINNVISHLKSAGDSGHESK